MEVSSSDGSTEEAGPACRLPREIVQHILLDSLDPFTILSMRKVWAALLLGCIRSQLRFRHAG